MGLYNIICEFTSILKLNSRLVSAYDKENTKLHKQWKRVYLKIKRLQKKAAEFEARGHRVYAGNHPILTDLFRYRTLLRRLYFQRKIVEKERKAALKESLEEWDINFNMTRDVINEL